MFIKRNFSTRPKVALVESVMKSISNSDYKPRKHPGIVGSKIVSLPENFVASAEKILADYPVKGYVDLAKKMNLYLKCRSLPMGNKKLKEVIAKAQVDVFSSVGEFHITTEEDDKRLKQSVVAKTKNLLKERVYNWQPINYNVNNSLIYLLARSAQEYAVLVQIMGEIALRDSEFKPRSLFDFGSGIGMGTWAAISYWKTYIYEYFNIDISKDMNDLAQALLQGGSTTGKMQLKGVFYRQFLPVSRSSYDLVICSYSLLELPSVKARMEMILKLWNKTESYLIIVEHGTRAGFQVINEVRDFVLQLNELNSGGYVFSPCPHDYICPKFASEKQLKCCFQVNYVPLKFFSHHQAHSELYSYVVLKKGKRESNSPEWPRLVEPTLVRSKHSICRMCTHEGKLKEIIFSASKHGKSLYYCARKTGKGDLLPITIQDEVKSDQIDEVESDQIDIVDKENEP